MSVKGLSQCIVRTELLALGHLNPEQLVYINKIVGDLVDAEQALRSYEEGVSCRDITSTRG